MKVIEAKIVLLGSQRVGKTSLVMKYITNLYSKDIAPTIGATFFNCRINVEDIKVKMQVWDTAGQERFRSMAPMYYRGANAALLVFDITNYNSFTEIKSWVSELHRNVQEPMILTLAGNKCDLDDERAVSREEATLYANSIGGNYFETSSITSQGLHGIEKAFTKTALGLIRLSKENNSFYIKRYESTDSIPNINLQSTASENPISNNAMITSAISLGVDSNEETNGEFGRVETVAFSIDHIAHGDEHRVGCCWF